MFSAPRPPGVPSPRAARGVAGYPPRAAMFSARTLSAQPCVWGDIQLPCVGFRATPLVRVRARARPRVRVRVRARVRVGVRVRVRVGVGVGVGVGG